MRITDNTMNGQKRIEDVRVGTSFYLISNLHKVFFILTNEERDGRYYCVNLETGETEEFASCTLVHPCRMELFMYSF